MPLSIVLLRTMKFLDHGLPLPFPGAGKGFPDGNQSALFTLHDFVLPWASDTPEFHNFEQLTDSEHACMHICKHA